MGGVTPRPAWHAQAGQGSPPGRAPRGRPDRDTEVRQVRVVPIADEVAHRLARLADRPLVTGARRPVFASPLGGHLDGSAPRRRPRCANLHTLPFHSQRPFFDGR
jgi:hypothetical protein